MSIGKNIKRARQEADMTQEQLAEFLNISVSAISQWESDKTTPDISMLPALCNIFQITSDKLLDIELEKNAEAIEVIRSEASKFSSKGKGPEAEKLLKEGLKKYPGSYEIMMDLMYIAYSQTKLEQCEEAVQKEYFELAIYYAERIINDCKEDSIRSCAKQIRCMAYADVGEYDKAKAIADTMDSIACCQETMRRISSKGTARYIRGQEEIFQLIQSLGVLMVCQNVELDDGTYPYSSEERALLREKHIAFLQLMFEEGDYGFFYDQMTRSYMYQAWHYAWKKEEEKTLQNLSLARDCALAFMKLDIKAEYTSLLLRGQEYGDFLNAADVNDADEVLEIMEKEDFDFLRENACFQEIQYSLQEYAGGWEKLER